MVKVEVYTNKGCRACVNAKRLFDSKGVAYEEKETRFRSARMDREFLDADPRAASRSLKSSSSMERGLVVLTMSLSSTIGPG